MIPGFPLAVPGIKYQRMAGNHLVRWDLAHLRCSRFMGCAPDVVDYRAARDRWT